MRRLLLVLSLIVCHQVQAISGASYDSKSKILTSGFFQGLFISPDGVYVFSTNEGIEIERRTMSTAWDISTAGAATITPFGGIQIRGLFFKEDGTKMYMGDFFNNRIRQYTLSTPWNVSSATLDTTMSYSGETTNARSIFINSTGTRLYIVALSTVYQYNLSTGWDLTTGSYASKSFTVSGQDGASRGIFFRPDGTKMYTAGNSTDSVHRYTIGTPGDITTASYDSDSYNFSGEETFPQTMAFKADGTKFYILGNDDTVYQYSSGETWGSSAPTFSSAMVGDFF
jgi:sugar lactone lactonase YvrE